MFTVAELSSFPGLYIFSLVLVSMLSTSLFFLYKIKKINNKYRSMSRSYNKWINILNESKLSWVFIKQDLTEIQALGNLFGINVSSIERKDAPKFSYENFLDIFDPTEAPLLKSKIRKIVNKEINKFILTLNLRNENKKIKVEGKIITNLITLTLSDGTDIFNERKLHSDVILSLLTLKVQFMELINLIKIPAWLRNTDGKIIMCNDEYANVFGKNKSEILANNMHLWADYSSVKTALSDKFPVNGAKKIISNNKYLVYDFKEKQKNSYFLGCAYNLSNLSKQEKTIKIYENTIEKTIQKTPNPTMVIDKNKKVVSYNDSFIKFFKFDQTWLETKPHLNDIFSDLYNRGIGSSNLEFSEYIKVEETILDNLSEPINTVETWRGSLKLTIMRFNLSEARVVYSFTIHSKPYSDTAILNLIDEGVITMNKDFIVKFVNNSALSLFNSNPEGKNIRAIDIPEFVYAINLLVENGKKQIFNDSNFNRYELSYSSIGEDHLVIVKNNTVLEHMYKNANQQKMSEKGSFETTPFYMLCEELKKNNLDKKKEIYKFINLHEIQKLTDTYNSGQFIPEFTNHKFSEVLKNLISELEFKLIETSLKKITCYYPQRDIETAFDLRVVKQLISETLVIFSNCSSLQIIATDCKNHTDLTITCEANSSLTNGLDSITTKIKSTNSNKAAIKIDFSNIALTQRLDLLSAAITTHGGKFNITTTLNQENLDHENNIASFNSTTSFKKHLLKNPNSSITKITYSIPSSLYIHTSPKIQPRS